MKNFLLKENFESVNLFEKINLLHEKQLRKIDQGFDWTINNLPSAVLVGGTATVHYISGARDLTPDLDFIVSDVGSVKNKLSLQGIKYSDLNPGYEHPIGITADMFNTDYLDSNQGNRMLNKLILSTPNKALIGGYTVNVINPELLAIMKLELGREKDINDGFALLSSGKVNREKYVKYLGQLKNTLEDFEAIYNYRNFIN
jgi:hypothetical protein